MTTTPLSIVVPAYNEESTIAEIIARLLILPEVCQIVIVNDCSTDRTGELADELARLNPKITVAHHPRNMGKTEALKTGFARTTGEIVIVQDADLEYDPAEICEVIAPIVNGHADVVYGSRFLVRKASRVLYFYHYVANKGLTFLSNLLTNLNMTDVETCYKAFRGEIIRNMVITSSGFGFEIEVTAKVAKLRGAIYEVPISYFGRTYEQGKKIGLKDGFAALWYIVWFNLFCSLQSSFTVIPRLAGSPHYPAAGTAREPKKISPASRGVTLGILFFIAAASLFVPKIGIEEDEVLFVPAVYEAAKANYSAAFRHQSWPVMLMSYVGADKVYLYKPILKRIRPSPWTLRMPVVLLGALTIWFLYTGVRRFTPEYVAAALACLIASDPIFLLTTTFDWGPVAIQHLMFMAGLACLARPKPWVATGFFTFGFALWDKGTAIWILGAMTLSAILFLTRPLLARLSRGNVIRATTGFIVGSLPFLVYNLTHNFATFRENTVFSMEGVAAKILAMYNALNGRGMFGWLMRGDAPLWYSLVPLALGVCVVLVFRKHVADSRPAALFALSTGLLTWLSMLFVKNGGSSLHHLILVWPWPHLFLICVLGATFRKRIFLSVAGVLIFSNLVMIAFYAQRTYTYGAGQAWSDATWKVAAILPKDRRVVILDWGIHNVSTFLTRGRIPLDDRTFSGIGEQDFAGIEQMQFLTHAQGEEMIAGNNARFDATIAKGGFMRVNDKLLSDSRGRPYIVSFHCIRQPL